MAAMSYSSTKNGQLTSEPEVRTAAFTTLPGQLPHGASALIASVGMGRQLEANQRIGDLRSVRGGVAYRRGLSEDLTMGAGMVQDGSTQLLAEAFYAPEQVPLQAALSAKMNLASGQAEVNANVRYQPAQNLKLAFNSDRFSQRFSADWRISSGLVFTAAGNSRERTLSVGGYGTYRINRWRGSARANIDMRQNLRWGLNAENGLLRLSHQGNEVSTYSDVVYRLDSVFGSNARANARTLGAFGRGHELLLSYETRGSGTGSRPDFETGLNNRSALERRAGNLATAQWRYRSPQRLDNGQSRWQVSLGYGVGSRGDRCDRLCLCDVGSELRSSRSLSGHFSLFRNR